MRLRLTAVLTIACVALGLAVGQHASASTSLPTIASSRASTLQSDPVTLYGQASTRYVYLYRKVGSHGWQRIRGAYTAHGRYHTSVQPVPGYVNYYRAGKVGSTHGAHTTSVRSVGCTPLAARGHVQVWLQDETQIATLPVRLAQLICSAAPRSTVSVASMFIYDDSPVVDRLIAALRNVAYYRGVHVQVLVERATYYSTARKWASLRHLFAFADVHYCMYGCHSSDPAARAHAKFVTVSRTIFGGPALLESSANWSRAQLVGERQSGVYVYGNTILMQAFAAEWQSLITHTASDARLWTNVGWGLAYSFDPHPVTADPVAAELSAVACLPGDAVAVVSSYVSRPAVIEQLNRLHAAGCRVYALRETVDTTPPVTFAMRTFHAHDKFVLIDAHTGSGADLHEVISGSENYRTDSMVLSDQQLLRIRRDDVWNAYRYWFHRLWTESQ